MTPVSTRSTHSRHTAAPINIQWGTDNRTVGIRSPIANPQARRIENRVIGADANPYVALAATLACGYLGIKNRIAPSAQPARSSHTSPVKAPTSSNPATSGTPNAKPLRSPWKPAGMRMSSCSSTVNDGLIR